jgi:hypothetical protein
MAEANTPRQVDGAGESALYNRESKEIIKRMISIAIQTIGDLE